MTNRWIEPVTLSGASVILEPLSLEHLEGIRSAVKDGELWKLWFTSIPAPENAEAYINTALDMRENAGAMPFIIRNRETNAIIGCTRYFNVDEINHRLEIGYTWYAESYQRTSANTEAKYLLLTHAFETLNAIAVEFREGQGLDDPFQGITSRGQLAEIDGEDAVIGEGLEIVSLPDGLAHLHGDRVSFALDLLHPDPVVVIELAGTEEQPGFLPRPGDGRILEE